MLLDLHKEETFHITVTSEHKRRVFGCSLPRCQDGTFNDLYYSINVYTLDIFHWKILKV